MTLRKSVGLIVTILGGVLMVIAGLAAMAGKHAAGEVEGAGMLYGFAVVIGIVGVWVFRKGKQLRALSADELISSDGRRPILYLRSFLSDEISSRSAAGSKTHNIVRTAIPQNLLGEEEQIALVMNAIGPFIGIGEPGEALPKLGAARMYLDDDSWQHAVRYYSETSSIVLLRVGDTAGFLWELENISKFTSPERIIFLLPDEEESYQTFREQAERHLPTVLPAELGPSNFAAGSFGGVLWFEPDWTAHVERCGMSFSVSSNTIASELRRLIQPVMEHLGLIHKYRLSGFVRRFIAFLIDITILGAVLVTLSLAMDQAAIDISDRNFGTFLIGLFWVFAYFSLEGTQLRATPGKKVMQLEVSDRYGVPITFQHALLRFFILFVEVAAVFPVFFSIAMMLLRKKTITDRLTRTQVNEVMRAQV